MEIREFGTRRVVITTSALYLYIKKDGLISITIELCEEEPSLSCKNIEVWRCFEGGTWL